MAFNRADNGFLVLDNVRIPRKRMLMKYAKVSADGTYTPPIHSKLNYGLMVLVRARMTNMQAQNLSSATTIALRYSSVKRQGRIEKNQREVQELDYQTQQYRLFPQIARAYTFLFTGDEIINLYHQTMDGVDKGDIDLLPDLHALTSGLKSVVTFTNGAGIEQCRMACDGHGYSDASGLPKIYGYAIAGCTYEGENVMLLQQAARYLMKSVVRADRGVSLSYSVKFIGKKGEKRSRLGMQAESDEQEIETLLSSLEHIARRLAVEASQEWEKRMKMGESRERAWIELTVEMNRAARVYTRLFVAQSFHRRVMAAPSSLRPVLTHLLSLYLHYECVDMAHHLLHDCHLTGDQINYLKKRLYEDLRKVSYQHDHS
ncbi:hypothetical protein PMAYCL1PPCAC_17174 [Pristionchus mayeri]|uniref:Uncharacterized protein n=1 Tax=Pristionchus mayeri TaxID=1317129 RepID=A0AAN5I038_9BILA|nr:hypothetical protein PMAYCL1PPCAC_17174 [Pristionchus mayeri]